MANPLCLLVMFADEIADSPKLLGSTWSGMFRAIHDIPLRDWQGFGRIVTFCLCHNAGHREPRSSGGAEERVTLSFLTSSFPRFKQQNTFKLEKNIVLKLRTIYWPLKEWLPSLVSTHCCMERCVS